MMQRWPGQVRQGALRDLRTSALLGAEVHRAMSVTRATLYSSGQWFNSRLPVKL